MEISGSAAIHRRFETLNVWQRGGERAPHKPVPALGLFSRSVRKLGAFTLADDHRVLVSEEAIGNEQFDHILIRHHAGQLNAPLRIDERPSLSSIAWHRAQVFKLRARPV